MPRTLFVAALALGIVGGSYGIASAATLLEHEHGTASSTPATPRARTAVRAERRAAVGRPTQ